MRNQRLYEVAKKVLKETNEATYEKYTEQLETLYDYGFHIDLMNEAVLQEIVDIEKERYKGYSYSAMITYAIANPISRFTEYLEISEIMTGLVKRGHSRFTVANAINLSAVECSKTWAYADGDVGIKSMLDTIEENCKYAGV